MSFSTLLCQPLPSCSDDPAGGGQRRGEHVVLCPVAGLPVQSQPAGRPVFGALCPMGEDRRDHSSCHLHLGPGCPRTSEYNVLLLQHGEAQPQPPPPVVRLPAGTSVFYQQSCSTERPEGAGCQLHAADQRGSEDVVGAAGPTVRMHQVPARLPHLGRAAGAGGVRRRQHGAAPPKVPERHGAGGGAGHSHGCPPDEGSPSSSQLGLLRCDHRRVVLQVPQHHHQPLRPRLLLQPAHLRPSAGRLLQRPVCDRALAAVPGVAGPVAPAVSPAPAAGGSYLHRSVRSEADRPGPVVPDDPDLCGLCALLGHLPHGVCHHSVGLPHQAQ